MSALINHNGKILRREEAGIPIDDHSYRYGDGLFETMKMANGKILLGELHFERLFHGFELLQFRIPEFFLKEKLEQEIVDLCNKNDCSGSGRVRLSVSCGRGGLYDLTEDLDYVIECSTLDSHEEKTLTVDIFPDARKSCDVFSNLKSANFLPYVMAAKFARKNNLDDCLVLNSFGRIADATVANVFWIKDRKILTPPLSEGCVAGVMRRWLIGKLRAASYELQEKTCEQKDLDKADEIFLTNVISGIRSVKRFAGRQLPDTFTSQLIRKFNTD